ncbi:NUDIX domain-containing protein [Maliponia aquimaris]|nr:NUDIX hydrolase [Maliponia aquimaris]
MSESDPRREFDGAKLLLFAGLRLVVLRRDNKPSIPWPGFLDFPGGARDGSESPETCVLRETREELGLILSAEVLRLAHLRDDAGKVSWFFAAHLPESILDEVVFGDEGQGWDAMPPGDFIEARDAIPHFRDILRDYLAAQGDPGKMPGPAG